MRGFQIRFQILRRSTLGASAFAMLLVLGGCPKHENFPTQLSVVEAPAPTDFVINALPFTSGSYDYDLTWTVSDPGNVDHYRLYLLGTGLAPELVAEPTGNALPISLPFNGQGLQFGLSTVSTGSIESSMTTAIIPALPTP
jgi:hypothetical protein